MYIYFWGSSNFIILIDFEQWKCITRNVAQTVTMYQRATNSARAKALIVIILFFVHSSNLNSCHVKSFINDPFGASTYKTQHINFRMFLDNENLFIFSSFFFLIKSFRGNRELSEWECEREILLKGSGHRWRFKRSNKKGSADVDRPFRKTKHTSHHVCNGTMAQCPRSTHNYFIQSLIWLRKKTETTKMKMKLFSLVEVRHSATMWNYSKVQIWNKSFGVCRTLFHWKLNNDCACVRHTTNESDKIILIIKIRAGLSFSCQEYLKYATISALMCKTRRNLFFLSSIQSKPIFSDFCSTVTPQ